MERESGTFRRCYFGSAGWYGQVNALFSGNAHVLALRFLRLVRSCLAASTIRPFSST
jgi:hypothetical protein